MSSGEDNLKENKINRQNMNDTFSKEGWQKVQQFKKTILNNSENDYCQLNVFQNNNENAISSKLRKSHAF